VRSFFITGTDTDVGKTLVSAGLLRLLPQYQYWKPVLTGAPQDPNAAIVQSLSGRPATDLLETTYSFREPLSAHLASRLDGRPIDPDHLVATARRHLAGPQPLIVEGAGGVMVPLAERYLQIDFIRELGLPVIVVVADRLGAINHTLLTLEACRSRGISVEGIILNRAGALEGNRESLIEYGDAPILARFFEERDPMSAVAAIGDCGALRVLLAD
jgi:dethiobiotin synthase